MGGVLVGFAIIAFVIAVGYAVGRIGILGPDAGRLLNRTAYFVTNPALLFTVLARADLTRIFSSFFAVAAIAALAAAAIYLVVSRIAFPAPVPETTIGTLAASYVNANNIGLPVAVYVLGDAQYVAPIILLQLVIFSPFALSVLDISSSGRASLGRIVTQPVRNPMILGSLAGVIVALTSVRLPAPVLQPFELLGGAAVPLVLMAFGMSLRGARPLASPEGRREVVVASLLKSVGMPLIAYGIARGVFGMTGHPLFAAVALAALPTAQNVYNFASRFGRGTAVGRDAGLVTTIAAVPVLIVVSALLA